MKKVRLHDGNTIDVLVEGNGPTILIPVNPIPITGAQAEEMKKWGADPALGRSIIDGLSDQYQVVAFDYEGHILQSPKPTTLTPDNIANDFLTIADAVGTEQFAYYGYSWLALSGMQLAIRTNRLSALIIGGFPPIDGPYQEMLQVTMATYHMSVSPQSNLAKDTENTDKFDWSNVEVTMTEAQTKQFVTLYEQLKTFNDKEAQTKINCPRLCFAGSLDIISYGEKWGNVAVDIVSPLIHQRQALVEIGWDVYVLKGLDHSTAMQAKHVLPILRPWLDSQTLT